MRNNSPSKHYDIPVGTSEPQDYVLKDEGEAFNGSGFTVTLEIKKKVGDTLTALDALDPAETEPTVAWLDATAGTVRVTGCDALTVGNYFVRYKVTAANVGFFPNGEHADLWHVVPLQP